MSVVLNENEWAEEMIAKREIGSKPGETLRRVAGYYYCQGLDNKAIRKRLEGYLLSCDPYISIPKWSEAIDRAIMNLKKYPPVNIDYISISQSELDKIDPVCGSQAKRLAFTLLCLSKYWNHMRNKADGWVNSRENEIMKIANISTTIRRRAKLFHDLREYGLIEFSKKIDNTNVRVLFGDDNDEALRIYDFRNLGYQYLMYIGEPFFECQNCGIVTKIKSNNHKYCPRCAVNEKLRRTVEATMVKSMGAT